MPSFPEALPQRLLLHPPGPPKTYGLSARNSRTPACGHAVVAMSCAVRPASFHTRGQRSVRHLASTLDASPQPKKMTTSASQQVLAPTRAFPSHSPILDYGLWKGAAPTAGTSHEDDRTASRHLFQIAVCPAIFRQTSVQFCREGVCCMSREACRRIPKSA